MAAGTADLVRDRIHDLAAAQGEMIGVVNVDTVGCAVAAVVAAAMNVVLAVDLESGLSIIPFFES